MKLHEVLPLLGIRDLRWLADAWAVEVIRKEDRAEYIDRILQKRHELLDEDHVRPRVSFLDLPYPVHTLVRAVLWELLNQPSCTVSVDVFHEDLVAQETELLDWAASPRSLAHLDRATVEIYKAVLDAAWQDGSIGLSEHLLVERLREKLGICERDHRVMEIQIGRFPSGSGGAHSIDEIENAAAHLVRHGLLIRPRLIDGTRAYCIPEELVPVLRSLHGIELIKPNFTSLLQQLPVATIRAALESERQPSSGTRDFLSARVLDGRVSPRTVLRHLTDEQLDALLQSLPGIRQDTYREVRIRRVVQYYDQLAIVAPRSGEPDTQLASYLRYYTDLAKRSYDLLRATNVVNRDREIERGFEQATTALFQDCFRHSVVEMPGNNHPDGRVDLPDGTRAILWDCKSCDTVYALTDISARQFLAYVAAIEPRVASPFLVIAPDFTADSVAAAHRLKTACKPGTEIALVTAADLLWLADTWKARADCALPWQILAVTGRLTRPMMEERLRTFAKAA